MSVAEMIPGSPQRADLLQRAVKGRSLWDDARRRLFANKAAVAGMIVLAVMVLAAIVGPFLVPFHYDTVTKPDVWVGPGVRGHLLGTDSLGRDLLSRLLAGLGVSLAIGVVATSVSLLIGVLWGAVAGYIGGRVDEIMMRVVDTLYSLPFIFFVILLMVTFGRNIFLIFLAIGAVEWLTMSRIVRGQTLSLKNKEFIEAARAAGLGSRQIILKHIVPNLLGPVVVYVTLTIPAIIIAESFLSFLGLGVQPPLPSWGLMISEAKASMFFSFWLIAIPGTALAVLIFAINLAGDGLHDLLSPEGRG